MAIYLKTDTGVANLDQFKTLAALSTKLTKHISDTDIIQLGSTTTGSVTWNTANFLAKGLYYVFIITVNSNLNSDSYKQEIACKLKDVNMGQNGNYYKLTSVFSGVCCRDNNDIIYITSYKNGGSWTGWATRGIFIPVANPNLS